MNKPKVIIKEKVSPQWIDYNGHMNDAEYARLFSFGVDRFMRLIGIDDEFRNSKQYTIYTLETHLCYLAEVKLQESIEVSMQVIDYDEKCVHMFYELYGENNKRAATSEQLLIGVDQKTRKASPFPETVYIKVDKLAKETKKSKLPDEVGRIIGIRKRK